MSVIFKVWVDIERIDEEADSFEDVGLPDPLGTFNTFEEACAFVRRLPGWEIVGSSSDYRQRDPALETAVGEAG